MRAAVQLLAVMFALLIWTGCGDGQQQPDISGVVDPHCAHRLDCNWEDDFEVCRQSEISSTAALTHVYGPECGEAWLDLLDCESSLECDDFLGCEAEQQRFNELCF